MPFPHTLSRPPPRARPGALLPALSLLPQRALAFQVRRVRGVGGHLRLERDKHAAQMRGRGLLCRLRVRVRHPALQHAMPGRATRLSTPSNTLHPTLPDATRTIRELCALYSSAR
eukprot:1496757-Rhodomonas_salina.1